MHMNKKKLVMIIGITSLIVVTGILYIILIRKNNQGETYFVDSKATADTDVEGVQEYLEKDATKDNLVKEAEESLVTDNPQNISVEQEKKSTEGNSPILIYVHICGAVENSGVYEVKDKSRLIDLVDAAGGMTKEAAKDYMNLAQLVEDGQRIYIPTIHEVEELSVMEAMNGFPSKTLASQDSLEQETTHIQNSSGIININEASKEQIMSLPGIGEAKAESILRYRDQYGGFTVIEDIMLVEGIKEGVFQKIKDHIRVN